MEESIARISFQQMKQTFLAILLKHGFDENKAATIAKVFAENSLDGVYTHGVNRFARFIEYVNEGYVEKDNDPVLQHSFGVIEQWNGNKGPGILNALHCTERAINLAKQNGIGVVGLANTNHWIRGGAYGWHAARQGYALICWTNTIGIMPGWGAKEAKLGKNPLVIAIPFKDEAIVLDMAMSQFSYGKMEMKAANGERFSVMGGFSEDGSLTNDPAAILRSKRPLPIGYWKGSGLALLLDLLAVMISGGQATYQISQSQVETNVSQVFIAFNLQALQQYSSIAEAFQNIIEDYQSAESEAGNDAVRYPGQNIIKTRNENLRDGISVDQKVWDAIVSL